MQETLDVAVELDALVLLGLDRQLLLDALVMWQRPLVEHLDLSLVVNAVDGLRVLVLG